LTLDVDPSTGDYLGTNHLDLAVSTSGSPLGSWNLFQLPTQDDGTQGTPDHGAGAPFLGDYPHIGADKYGFYFTTNEYSFFGPNCHAAQIYAFSRNAVAAGAASVTVTQFDTLGLVQGQPGFTVWPATAPGGQYAGDQKGTEYFMSPDAAGEAGGNGSSTHLIVWALSKTKSLDSAQPAPKLTNTVLTLGQYSIPPLSAQQAGNFPLGQAINDTKTQTPFGKGAWRYFFDTEPAHNEVEWQRDSKVKP
jgi:hypothetical protein